MLFITNVGDDHQKDSPPSTPLQKSIMPAKRSPLAELLVYPTPTQKASKTKSCARVLTSAESIAMLEEKARKKEEQEEKERKKKDRELKKAANEEEKKRKAQERQAKQAEKQKKSSGQKRNNSSCDGSRSKQQKLDRGEDESQDAGIQHHEISKDECAACFGLFEDDADSVEWIECTNENCRVWAHAERLEMCDNAYVCIACETLLV